MKKIIVLLTSFLVLAGCQSVGGYKLVKEEPTNKSQAAEKLTLVETTANANKLFYFVSEHAREPAALRALKRKKPYKSTKVMQACNLTVQTDTLTTQYLFGLKSATEKNPIRFNECLDALNRYVNIYVESEINDKRFKAGGSQRKEAELYWANLKTLGLYKTN